MHYQVVRQAAAREPRTIYSLDESLPVAFNRSNLGDRFMAFNKAKYEEALTVVQQMRDEIQERYSDLPDKYKCHLSIIDDLGVVYETSEAFRPSPEADEIVVDLRHGEVRVSGESDSIEQLDQILGMMGASHETHEGRVNERDYITLRFEDAEQHLDKTLAARARLASKAPRRGPSDRGSTFTL
jgi:hypothetical protein